jgi:hypothetical protein
VNAILPKMGIARSAPRKVVFGTKQYGGIGLTHLAALQGNSRLQYLLGHLRCGDTTGELRIHATGMRMQWQPAATGLQEL